MRRVVPQSPTFWDYAHIGLGIALAAIAMMYFVSTMIDGGWRRHFPWLVGNLSEFNSDLRGIARLKIPSAGGAGLFSLLQGLLILFLLAAAATGTGWLVADGSRAALAWREWHAVAANVFAWLLVAHVVASALHVLDFLRD